MVTLESLIVTFSLPILIEELPIVTDSVPIVRIPSIRAFPFTTKSSGQVVPAPT